MHAKALAALEQTGADDDFVAQDGLVVVDVRGAVGAVVAVYVFAWMGCWFGICGGEGADEGGRYQNHPCRCRF